MFLRGGGLVGNLPALADSTATTGLDFVPDAPFPRPSDRNDPTLAVRQERNARTGPCPNKRDVSGDDGHRRSKASAEPICFM